MLLVTEKAKTGLKQTSRDWRANATKQSTFPAFYIHGRVLIYGPQSCVYNYVPMLLVNLPNTQIKPGFVHS